MSNNLDALKTEMWRSMHALALAVPSDVWEHHRAAVAAVINAQDQKTARQAEMAKAFAELVDDWHRHGTTHVSERVYDRLIAAFADVDQGLANAVERKLRSIGQGRP